MPTITHVWIDDGCTVCNACESAVPEVFRIGDLSAEVLGDVRADGRTSRNADERSALSDHTWDEAIREAAAGCPVDVIRVAAA